MGCIASADALGRVTYAQALSGASQTLLIDSHHWPTSWSLFWNTTPMRLKPLPAPHHSANSAYLAQLAPARPTRDTETAREQARLVAGHGLRAPPDASTSASSPVDQTEVIHTTANHPWLTADRGWLLAGDLRVGEAVRLLDGGTARVVALRALAGVGPMWDLSLDAVHTFAVGSVQAVVHNVSCFNSPPLSIDDAQFGAKVGKHSADFGLDPAGPAARAQMRATINDIHDNFDEVRQGPWNPNGGGGSDYLFYRQGANVVVTQADGQFVTILRGGETNGWFQRAIPVAGP